MDKNLRHLEKAHAALQTAEKAGIGYVLIVCTSDETTEIVSEGVIDELLPAFAHASTALLESMLARQHELRERDDFVSDLLSQINSKSKFRAG